MPTPAADTDGDGDWGKIEFVSKLVVPDAEPELIADVAVDPEGEFAYLARWCGAACAGPESNVDGGVYVVDIRDLSTPTWIAAVPVGRLCVRRTGVPGTPADARVRGRPPSRSGEGHRSPGADAWEG